MVKVQLNEEKKGVEVVFDARPEREVLEQLKGHGFRWHNVNKLWYAKQTDERVNFAKSLVAPVEAPKAKRVSKKKEA